MLKRRYAMYVLLVLYGTRVGYRIVSHTLNKHCFIFFYSYHAFKWNLVPHVFVLHLIVSSTSLLFHTYLSTQFHHVAIPSQFTTPKCFFSIYICQKLNDGSRGGLSQAFRDATIPSSSLGYGCGCICTIPDTREILLEGCVKRNLCLFIIDVGVSFSYLQLCKHLYLTIIKLKQ